jgi:rhodanese-related sulfurtransferase
MAKQSGLGDNLYVDGVDLSGDTGGIGNASGGISLLDVTAIDKSAMERIGGIRSGQIEWSSWWNPANSHLALRTLPMTDRIVTYFRGTALGSPAAALVAKQINYDHTRGADGSFSAALSAESNGYGLEWGIQLTPGKKTDATATNGTGVDTTASASFGGQFYLQVFALTGTSVTVKVQDSADNATFADITGATFAAATGPGAQRLQLGPTATVRRYIRAISTGTFTNAVFAVVAVKNTSAVTF